MIWFDDEFESLNIIKEKAALSGIQLIGFDNAEEGMSELRRNVANYDGGIVDGNFFRYPGKTGNVNDKAFGYVAKELILLDTSFPWFVLSGQMNFTKESNKYADVFKDGKVYDKLKNEDLDSLWDCVKTEADSRPETQVRHEFSKVFEACTERSLGSEAEKPLLQILKSIRNPTSSFDDELYFTQVRIILELMFRAANKLGLLHDKCLDSRGKVNLSESSLFLSGLPTSHLGVSCAKSHFPKIISDAVKSILFITGAASHTIDPEVKNNLNLVDYRKKIDTPYLLYSITFQLVDILIWYRQYSEENLAIEENKKLWRSDDQHQQEGDWTKGEVVRVADNGFGTFQPSSGGATLSIIPSMVNEFKLREKQTIEVITKADPTGTKKLIKSIRVLKP